MLRGGMRIQTCLIALSLSMPARAVDDPALLFNGQNLFGWTYHLAKPDAHPATCGRLKTVCCVARANRLVT